MRALGLGVPIKGRGAGYFANLTCMVFGASSGIGMALARELKREGAQVAVCARRERELQKVGADLVIKTDVTDAQQVEHAFSQALDYFGGKKIDVVINSAGSALAGDIRAITPERITAFNRLHMDGTAFIYREALTYIADGGHIVFVSSKAAEWNLGFGELYSAAKGAALHFALAAQRTLDTNKANFAQGVRVHCVLPGAVGDTEIWREEDGLPRWMIWVAKNFSSSSEACAKKTLRGIRQGRFIIRPTWDASLSSLIPGANTVLGIAPGILHATLETPPSASNPRTGIIARALRVSAGWAGRVVRR